MKFPHPWRRSCAVDKSETEAAEADVRARKRRGDALHAEVLEIIRNNNLGDKFHAALRPQEGKR